MDRPHIGFQPKTIHNCKTAKIKEKRAFVILRGKCLGSNIDVFKFGGGGTPPRDPND